MLSVANNGIGYVSILLPWISQQFNSNRSFQIQFTPFFMGQKSQTLTALGVHLMKSDWAQILHGDFLRGDKTFAHYHFLKFDGKIFPMYSIGTLVLMMHSIQIFDGRKHVRAFSQPLCVCVCVGTKHTDIFVILHFRFKEY